ncbi:PREDICTED: uncharacterized protein LOC108969588, partial [Bactrocera latifrons]|uniref:uncharacterized protein LOC108969588 n=1 Tax=Bactrocera latifrons TaxID=174628 RepID=UPI0008DE5DA4
SVIGCHVRGDQIILLATACAYVSGDNSEERLARILCDPGSQVSFITERFANSLNLHRSSYDVAVEGIGALSCTRTKGVVAITLKSTHSQFSVAIHDAPPLGDSYGCALRQFYRLERRLSSDTPLRDKYIAFMKEYIELGHMEALGTYNDSNR